MVRVVYAVLFVDNCIEQFNDFGSIAYATLQMTADMLERKITQTDSDLIMHLFKQLPLHPQVAEGLSALTDQGYRLAALTNSSELTVRERMNNTVSSLILNSCLAPSM